MKHLIALLSLLSTVEALDVRPTTTSRARSLGISHDTFLSRFLPQTCYRRSLSVLRANNNDDDAAEKPKKSGKKKKKGKKPKPKKSDEDKQKSREELVKAVGEKMRSSQKQTKPEEQDQNLFDRLNPFKAGQSLRKTIDTALTSIAMPREKKSMYYLDDRLMDGSAILREGSLERLDQDDYVPEVLVVGATGEVGRLVVRRLLLDGRFRVRVLVRDLYTKTLNVLGTGVTYCQGDLSNMDSLEYALTDVDKIVFCASAPRPDEDDFQQKFQDFMQQTFEGREDSIESLQHKLGEAEKEKTNSDIEWEQLESVLEVRARLAEQVDCVGMQNLVRAYQHVRHADYGTSQAAKRSLFKFQDRPEDFNLFMIDDEDTDAEDMPEVDDAYTSYYDEMEDEDDEEDYDEYDDDYDEYEDYGSESIEKRRDTSVKTQVQWIRNKFEHAVFVGRVPKAVEGGVGGEAAIVSSRLRSREDPENGIDLSNGFAGFICRVCSDGGTYEAFVRTRTYYDDGIEYVCEFSTSTKPVGKNKSKNKFITVRLPFQNFKPVRRSTLGKGVSEDESIPVFRGGDVRNIGFRYRSASNTMSSKLEQGDLSSFYLALSYIKLYRSQPEPEFVYLSDARIPPVVRNSMIRHEARQLVVANGEAGADDGSYRILDESTLRTVTEDKMNRSPEETYYKFRGEDILKKSGLSYAIVRVCGFNESPSGEASTIDLKSTNDGVTAVSRAEVAQVCANALLDPCALNKSFYISKKQGQKSTSMDEDISRKFSALPVDQIA